MLIGYANVLVGQYVQLKVELYEIFIPSLVVVKKLVMEKLLLNRY